MKVIVLGATGFVALPVAQAFVRAGHVVYGQTRSAAKAKELVAEEIIPLVGEATDVAAWRWLLATADVVIDSSGGMNPAITSATILQGVTAAIESGVRHSSAPKLTYIYCSGTWVHGDDRVNTVTDTTACPNPPSLMAWRVGREQEVVRSKVLNGISAYEGKVAWYGRPGGRYAMIHQDDLADLILRAAQKGRTVAGCIFDAANPATESVDDFLDKLVKVSGAQGAYSYIKPSNAYEEALQTTSLLRPYLGNALLDWIPKKPSLVDGLETYYASWKASKDL